MNKGLTFLMLFFSVNLVAQSALSTLKFRVDQIQHEKEIAENEAGLLSEEEKLLFLLMQEYLKTAGFPVQKNQNKVIHHSVYSLSYNEKHEQADWVMHVLSPEIDKKNYGRTIPFKTDSLVASGTAEKEDYDFPGFDRGHLAPSADFCWSLKAKNESYLYSNIAPQKTGLNRGKWMEMENALRNYAVNTNHHLVIITGGVLQDELPFIGSKNRISVPRYFYKAAVDMDDSLHPCIAFLMPNEKCEDSLYSYAISIDSLEQLTGIDFFTHPGNKWITNSEGSFDEAFWTANSASKSQVPNNSGSQQSVQNQETYRRNKQSGNQLDR